MTSNSLNETTVAGLSEAEQVGPTTLERVMLAIALVTLAGCCLLISAPEGMEAGQRAWSQGSVLRVVTELLSLSYEYPTRRGLEVKWFVQGLGVAAALLALGIGWYGRSKRDEQEPPRLDEQSHPVEKGKHKSIFSSIAPAPAAQIALLGFGVYVMLSVLWAPWPAGAFGEGVRQLMVILWAVALGRTFNRRSVRWAAFGLVAVLTVTAALGIWYYYERSPVQRLKFPIGNPIFLAACLIPGITLALGGLIAQVVIVVRQKRGGETRLNQPYRWWLLVGAVIALLILAWAFKLTDSRSPLLGLLIGVVAAAYVLVFRQLRWPLVGLALVLFFCGSWWFRAQLGVQEGGRGASTQLRLYAWSYATDLFLERPDIGKGQGAYLLLAQEMSRADAQNNPVVFPGPLLGHAHSEWLEILADLGAFGIGIMATGLIMTFWSGLASLRRLRNPVDRWCLLGLLAAFVAIIIEEAGDVGLRMPGLPLIFYTVIGLIWAMSREPEGSVSCVVRSHSRPVRLAVLVGTIAAGLCIMAAAWRDWQGALADSAIMARAENQQWGAALALAKTAESGRLTIEDRLAAVFNATEVAHNAATYQLQQIQGTISRIDPQKGVQHTLLQLAAEDGALFEGYFNSCLKTGGQLLQRCPTYPLVAGWLADVWLMRGQMHLAAQKLGLRGEVAPYLPEARKWLEIEYARDPLNARNGLRLLQLSSYQPLAYRINLLRVPLRGGPILPEVETALVQLMREQGYGKTMNQFLQQAQAAMNAPNVASWPDRFAPETLRLAALANKLIGQFDKAAMLAGQAGVLSEKIRGNFPTAPSYARIYQARYLLLAYPDDPKQAVEACRQAIEGWPPFGDRQERLKPLWRDMSLYLLATGDEDAMVKVLRMLVPQISPEILDRNIGYGLAELCDMFMPLQGHRRPKAFNDWLRRSLQLAPEWPAGRLIAAHVALERGDDSEAIGQLRIVEGLMSDQDRFAAVLRSLLTLFPDNAALRTFAAERLGGELPQTSTAPAK